MEIPPGIPIDQVPGMKPPPGVTPNFAHPPDDYQSTIVATLAVCLTVATLLSAMRLYAKAYIIKSFALEDYASCVAWLANAVEITYCITMFSTKLAILVQIQHIFVTSRRSIRFILVQLVIWINAIWYFLNIWLDVFPCTPRNKVWNPLLPGHCSISYDKVDLTSTVFNMVSDLFILVLPIWWVWKLQMAKKRKLGISLIFASGTFSWVASILRLHARLVWGKSPDQTWYLSYDGLWIFAEICGGIICACLPMNGRLVDQFSSSIRSRLSRLQASRDKSSESSEAKIIKDLRHITGSKEATKEYVELRGQVRGNQSLSSKGSANLLDSKPTEAYSAV